MRRPRVITVARKRWRLSYERPVAGSNADCDSPTTPNKKIRITPGLRRRPRELLEVLIHELLHAAGWPLAEEFVEQAGADIARVLWQEGYRLTEQNDG
jgi:hypothetical protein